MKLKMLQPRLKTLPDRIPTARRPRAASKASGRDADPRRTLALNTAAWQRLRASVLAEQPLCACGCMGIATDVDHINGDPSDNSRENLQGLTHECHSRKTARDHGRRVNGGCDATGQPSDPAHPWNQSPKITSNRGR